MYLTWVLEIRYIGYSRFIQDAEYKTRKNPVGKEHDSLSSDS